MEDMCKLETANRRRRTDELFKLVYSKQSRKIEIIKSYYRVIDKKIRYSVMNLKLFTHGGHKNDKKV